MHILFQQLHTIKSARQNRITLNLNNRSEDVHVEMKQKKKCNTQCASTRYLDRQIILIFPISHKRFYEPMEWSNQCETIQNLFRNSNDSSDTGSNGYRLFADQPAISLIETLNCIKHRHRMANRTLQHFYSKSNPFSLTFSPSSSLLVGICLYFPPNALNLHWISIIFGWTFFLIEQIMEKNLIKLNDEKNNNI